MYEIGCSIDVEIHNEKALLSVGTAALGLVFCSHSQKTNRNRGAPGWRSH